MTNRRVTTATPPSETLTPPGKSKKPSPNVGEVAGGTAANIFVVCCCCPCGLAECLILSVYKLPVNFVRRMWRNHRHRRRKLNSKKKLLDHGNGDSREKMVEGGGAHGLLGFNDEDEMKKKVSNDGAMLAEEFDRRMWDQFCDTGFWRTCSQRHT
ncbi:uncharacterized protein LOC141590349 [Silene latifolia]|uniref:uncharacterized protein LOC141590349 n=1 Tax=Silene latifolia TaxID=37657 RepID=UPI003D78926F